MAEVVSSTPISSTHQRNAFRDIIGFIGGSAKGQLVVTNFVKRSKHAAVKSDIEMQKQAALAANRTLVERFEERGIL